jgi:hypothetical protein
MSTAKGFRRIALGMKDAIEGAHMGHPDFRAHGRIFATLHSGSATGMVKLTPEDQKRLVREHPGAFAPENGAWGRAGCTRVQLGAIDEEGVGEARTLAWQASAAQAATRARPPAVGRRRRPARGATDTLD